MSVVQEVKQNPKKPENAYIKFLDGTEAWCPSFEAASKLVIGEPLPEGWHQDQGDFGPRAFPPRPQGGRGGGAPAAFRNTKEGFLLEQDSIHRSVALAQAIEYVKAVPADEPTWERLSSIADDLYAWLRKTAPSSVSVRPPSDADSGAQAGGDSTAATPPADTSAVTAAATDGGAGRMGKAAGPSITHKPGCTQPGYTPLKKSGEAMPEGKLRCIECSVTANEADLP